MYDKKESIRKIDNAIKRVVFNGYAEGREKANEADRREMKRLQAIKDRIESGEEVDLDSPIVEPTRPDPTYRTGAVNNAMIEPVTDRSYRGMFFPGRPEVQLSTDGWNSQAEFLRTFLQGRSDPRFQFRALNEGVGTDGGFLIPQQYSQVLMDQALKQEVIRPLCKVYPMNSADLYVPGWDDLDLSGGDLAGFTMEWLGESQTGTERTGKLRSLHLQAKSGVIYANVTMEMLQDAPGFANALNDILSKSLARGIDKALIRGTDSAGPSSILKADCLITVNKETSQSATTFEWKNASKMFSRQLDHDGAVWLMNQNVIPQLLTNLNVAVGTGGSPIDVLSERDGKFHLLGKPVLFSDQCKTLGTKGDVFYLNPSYLSVGMRQEITVHTTDSHRWLQREHSFRIVVRMDAAPAISKVVQPEQGSTLSPFVALQTRS